MKLSHISLIVMGGVVWFIVGAFLLPFGLHLLMDAMQTKEIFTPFINGLNSWVGGRENSTILIITLALFIGSLKGKFVLGKSARRSVLRVKNYPSPTAITQLYNFPYCLLILSMIALGMLMKFFVSQDIRGFVDVAVGTALIRGAMIFFRSALDTRTQSTVY